MSMLAGPRRKQKVINLRAKNSAWSNDNNKFGQRMLEKMGWSSGKGLGANEDGIVEHVVAKYKNDDKGLGYEDRNDQWTKHEDDFNALLSNLSSDKNGEDQLHSGVSLEVKSKKSKARIHYHKFTRGKDISRYSEKDLANIFGKKSFKEQEKVETTKDNIKMSEQVFTEKGSMEDYFKNKLLKFKSNNNIVCQNNDMGAYDESEDCGFKGFSVENNSDTELSHQGFGFQSFSFQDSKENSNDANTNKGNGKKTKKKKKNKCFEPDQVQNDSEVSNVISDAQDSCLQEGNTLEGKVKKSKKKTCEVQIETDEPVKKKKKSKNSAKEMDQVPIQDAREGDLDTEITEVHVPKKKKKRKNQETAV